MIITEENTNTKYDLIGDEIGKMVCDAGKKRKEKEEAAHSASPLVPSKTIFFTSNVGGERETAEYSVYVIKSREDKRKLRNVVQSFFDECKMAREEDTDKPSPLIIQRGSDEENDMVIIRSGLDIAVTPLRKSKKEEEGYVAAKPPAYGDDVDNSSKAFQKVLKLVEGVRSESATPLRHIAKKDENFIGKAKGGAKKLRNYDQGMVTKADKERVLTSFMDLFIKETETEEYLPEKDKILEKVKDALATETDSPSFYK